MAAISEQMPVRKYRFGIRNQIITVIMIAMFIPVIIVVGTGLFIGSTSLIRDVDQELHRFVEGDAVIIREMLRNELNLLQLLTVNDVLRSGLMNHEAEDMATIQQKDAEWTLAHSANRDDVTPIRAVLNNPISAELRAFTELSPNHLELYLTDVTGVNVAATRRTNDYYQADEFWWQTAWNQGEGQLYLDHRLEFDNASNTLNMAIAMPVHHPNGQIIGILRSTYQLNAVQSLIVASAGEDSTHLVLVDGEGRILASPDQEHHQQVMPELPLLMRNPDAATDGRLDYTVNERGERAISAYYPVTTDGEVPALDALNWHVVIFQTESNAFALLTEAMTGAMFMVVVIALLLFAAAVLMGRQVSEPLHRLAQSAQEFEVGQTWSAHDLTQRNDEIGEVANGFQSMTNRIQELVGILESRVIARTRAIEAVTDVNAQVASVLDTERLLQDVADLTKERFRLYHAHVYLLDEDRANLRLKAGAGHVGRQMVSDGHYIPLNHAESIVAMAARQQKTVFVNDVSSSEFFLAHPLLPDTRSEVAIPLITRGAVLGVLSVKSEEVDFFDNELRDVLTLLGGQIAIALSNAQLYEEASRNSRHQQALGKIEQSIQTANTIDELIQIASRELGKALRVPHTSIELQLPSDDPVYAAETPLDTGTFPVDKGLFKETTADGE
jgi:putative methionine-R-sulfoxide reductase with GAF domain